MDVGPIPVGVNKFVLTAGKRNVPIMHELKKKNQHCVVDRRVRVKRCADVVSSVADDYHVFPGCIGMDVHLYCMAPNCVFETSPFRLAIGGPNPRVVHRLMYKVAPSVLPFREQSPQ